MHDTSSSRVAADGELGAAFSVAPGLDDQRAPDAACGAQGECLVTWEREAAIGISG